MRQAWITTIVCGAALSSVTAGPPNFVDLTADDAAMDDLFGSAVAVTGDLGLIGAPGDDDNGTDSGSVYLYDLTLNSSVPQGKILAAFGSPFDGFGSAIAANPTWTLIGAPGYDRPLITDSGAVYRVATGDVVTPPTLIRLGESESDPRDEFGYSVAVDAVNPTFAVVGAPGDDGDTDTNNRPDAGAAYLVNLGSGVVIPDFKYVGSDTFSGDRFGTSVALSDTVTAVGAPYDGVVQGAVYLFQRSPDIVDDEPVLVQFSKIISPDRDAGEQFGMSIAMDGDILVVGAPGNSFNGRFSGAVHIFDISDPTMPVFIVTLRPTDFSTFDFFGESVAISGDTVVIGAPFDDDGDAESGSVFTFNLSSGDDAKIRACSGRDGDNFGVSVAVDVPRLLVGAWGDDTAGVDAGAATSYNDIDIDDPFDDCDGNGEPDTCELLDNPNLDCGPLPGGNGILDICDIVADPTLDCDGNLEIDRCEIDAAGGVGGVGGALDCWPVASGGNGVLDVCDIADGLVDDCDGNGVPDICEINDAGGVGGFGGALDCNFNGVLDECDIVSGVETDCDDNGVPDSCQLAADPATFDCDGNGLFDACEIDADPALDCNEDGILDSCQMGDPALDCDGDGEIDACQINDAGGVDGIGGPLDCNLNGELDDCEVIGGTADDCNLNGTPDDCEIAVDPAVFDCNGNGVLDACEIDAAGGVGGVGGPLDTNSNGLLDECEDLPCPADLNGDGVLDLTDISLFVFAFQLGLPEADYNNDGTIDLGDLTAFVADYQLGCP